jgi:hypothetical protein
MPQVVATPHIAASTEEAQELVGTDTAATVRDFLRSGVLRNAVNFPSLQHEALQRLMYQQTWRDQRQRRQLVVLQQEVPAIANLVVEEPGSPGAAMVQDNDVGQLEDSVPGQQHAMD